jgi:hypothetical protein
MRETERFEERLASVGPRLVLKCMAHDKGKPTARWGRKATDLLVGGSRATERRNPVHPI